MIGRDVERMPYWLTAVLLLFLGGIGILGSLSTATEGLAGLFAGMAVGALLVFASSFLNRLMIQKGYQEERDREPVRMTEWAWLAFGFCILATLAVYSGRAPFVGYLGVLLVWGAADLWPRRKLSK